MNSRSEPLAALALKTHKIYERNAARFDAERPKGLHERVWLDRFTEWLPVNGSILDLGCGAGDPIAKFFMNQGFAVTGVDFSSAMLELAKARFPGAEWILGDMRQVDLGRQFHGIIGWNSFFHLTQPEQRSTLERLADHLASGGALMLTVGPEAGEVDGHVGDDRVYHSSLSPDEYARILARRHIEIVEFKAEDPDCDFQTVLLARKARD